MYRTLNHMEIERTFDKIKMSEIKEDDNDIVSTIQSRWKSEENGNFFTSNNTQQRNNTNNCKSLVCIKV